MSKRRTVAGDLSWSLALTVAGVVTLAAGAFVFASREASEARLAREARRWTDQLAEVSVLHLWNVDREGLRNVCQAALQPPEVRGARVLDAEGRSLAAVGRVEPGEAAGVTRLEAAVIHTDPQSGRAYRLGQVQLWVSSEALEAHTRTQLLAAALLGLLVVGAVVLACRALLRRYLGAPLDLLEEGIERVGAGDYDLRLPSSPREDMDAIAQGINAMAGAIASREEELRQSQEQLSLALLASKSGVWDWQVEAQTVYYSERWKSMLGYEDHEVENSFEAWSALVHPEDHPKALAAIEAHFAGETEHYVLEHRLRCKDGSYRWVAARGKLISRTPEGAPLRFVGTHTDITAQIEAATALQAAKEAAEQATRAKDEFLANVSHEIRTPLNGVLGMTSLLLETKLSGPQREAAQTIGSSSRALLSVVNDILDFSRIESGALPIEREPFDPREVCRAVRDLFAPEAASRGLELALELEGDHPAWLRGDEARIRQVLLNLVGNAIKFTPAGTVTLALRSEPGTAGQVRVRYEVQDTGVGIAPEGQRAVFRRFTQLDTSSTRAQGGTGLGLAISEGLAQLMGGTLGLESEVGQGSRFWLELELEALAERELLPRDDAALGREPEGEQAPLEGRVLVAEDNRVNARVAEALLAQLGLEAELVVTGREALDSLAKGDYDLVLMDIQMPVLDGLSAVRELRAREEAGSRRTPVVALTASALAADAQRCLEAGMDDFLAKPITLEQLEAKLRRWLGRASVGGA